MVTTTQLSLIIGGTTLPSILAAVDMHLRTNRLIAKIDRLCDKPGGVGSTEYQRHREEERLIFEERIRRTYLPRDGN